MDSKSLDISTSKFNVLNGTLPMFLQYCEELSFITASHGFEIQPHNQRGIEQFITLSTEQQIQILESVRSYINQLHDASAQKVDIVGDNRKHAWWSLKCLQLVPPDDLFDKLAPSDIIEIYDRSSIQIFRSLELFKHISYSFSEIFSFTWMDLFERDDFMFRRLFEIIDDSIKGKTQGIIGTDFPSHIVCEKSSPNKYWIRMKHRLICPLFYSNGSIGGYINAFSIVEHGKGVIVKS